MNFQLYHIGIVTSPAGITDRQDAWMRHTLADMRKHCPDLTIKLTMAGFNYDKPGRGVHKRLWSNPRVQGTEVECVCVPGMEDKYPLGHQSRSVVLEFKDHDEVWIMPFEGQDGYLCRNRPATVYRDIKQGLGDYTGIMQRTKFISPHVERPTVALPAEPKAKPQKGRMSPWNRVSK